MARVFIHGTPKNASKVEMRCLASAASMILEHHGYDLYNGNKLIHIYLKTKTQLPDSMGVAFYKNSTIHLRDNITLGECQTIITHEIIHLYIRFENGEVEKLTSTLCSRLLPDITKIFDALILGNYRRAAYIAHTKLSYKPKPGQKDFYDKAEWKAPPASEYGRKFRRN